MILLLQAQVILIPHCLYLANLKYLSFPKAMIYLAQEIL